MIGGARKSETFTLVVHNVRAKVDRHTSPSKCFLTYTPSKTVIYLLGVLVGIVGDPFTNILRKTNQTRLPLAINTAYGIRAADVETRVF